MSFDGVAPQLVLTLGLIGTAVLLALEWRRRDSRNRLPRIAASFAAVVSLGLLGIYRIPSEPKPAGVTTNAVLWTHNADVDRAGAYGAALHFALPRASSRPASAALIPDVGYLRREFPQLEQIRIVGDGLEPSELDVLAGVQVMFEETRRDGRAPSVSFVQLPRELLLGDKLRVQGRVDALVEGEAITLTLVGPDGSKSEATAAVNGTFELVSGSPPAEGRFAWRVQASRASDGGSILNEEFGVAVVRRALPRLLVLESSPRLDTAHLQRWFAELGGTLVARTSVGNARYRFTSSTSSSSEFDRLDRELLSAYDVLLIDPAALAALSPEERQAINDAVSEEGLGMLALVAGAVQSAQSGDPLLPWQFEPVDADPASSDADVRTARLQWTGRQAPLEHPVPIAPVRLVLAPHQSTLVTDAQDRPIASSIRHGRGQLALSIARDTWKWRLQDQASLFAAYWSHLLERVAKSRDPHAPRWTIENPGSAPLAVNRPVQLRLAGPRQTPADAHARCDAEQQVTLPLAQDPAEQNVWRTTYWPRGAGWHRVQLGADGAHLDFFVHQANAWSSLGPARRSAATQLAVAQQTRAVARREQEPPARSAAVSVAGLYALFLVSVGYLWLERRRAAA